MLGSRISTKSRTPEAVNIQADCRQTKTPQFHTVEPLRDFEKVEQLSNETLAGVLESISDGFIAIDREWRVTYLNKAGRDIVRDALQVGVNLWEACPDLRGTHVEEAYRKVVRENVAADAEYYEQKSNRWFELRVFPAKGQGISVFFRDVTERKQSSEQFLQLKTQLETQVADLRRFHDLNSRLVASASVQDMLNQVLNAALELHGTDKGMISLVSPDGLSLQLACSTGFSNQFLGAVHPLPCSSGACAKAFKSRNCVIVEDVHDRGSTDEYREAARAGAFRAAHSTPLITPQGRLVGVLTVHFAQPHRPTERHVQLTIMYAQKAADLIESALAREKAHKDLLEKARTAEQLRDLKLALETQVADLRNLQDLNRMNEERFRMAAYGDAITLYEQDADLRYTWLFPAQSHHAGALGRTDAEILDGPEGKVLEEWKREVMRTGVSQRREVTTVLKGRTRRYDMSIVPRRDHRRQIIGVAGAALDITARTEAERAMRQLAAIVECSEDAIISEDVEGTIISWNKAAERIFGYTAQEMIGQSIRALIPQQGVGEQEELMAKIVKGEPVACFETVRCHKDGRSIHVSISVSPLRNEAQQIVGASKILRDISAQKRREAQERAIYELAMQVNRAGHVADIFDAAVAAIMRSQSADRASILLYDSEGVMRFKSSFGLSDEYQRAVEGHSPWKINDPDPQPICIDDVAAFPLDDHLRAVIDKEGIRALAFIPITYESQLLGKFMVYYNAPHAFEPTELRPTQTIATQVAFAIQRQQTEKRLENLVEERTTSLREAVQQMEEFSYTISHDLRAPLRAMQVYSQALLEDFAESLPPEGVRYVKRLSDNATRLDKMILDVLSFSRIARGNHTMEHIKLDKLVREIVSHYPEMQPPRAQLTIEPLTSVIGHEPSLTQVISNLLSNAVKFVPAGVMPTVKVWTESHGRFVRLFVQDNGIGIPSQYLHKLFNMFERVHPELPYEGTGVGLAIVRKAVERMNGTFGVESQSGAGSKFWIQLPAAEQTS